jgi:hypothetical protein
MKLIIAALSIIIGSSAYAQEGAQSAKAGLALSQSFAQKRTLDNTVKVTNVEISGKIIDAPNYRIDGTIHYTVNGKTLTCAIGDIELELRERVRLCNDGRAYYPVVSVAADEKATRLYININDSGVLYDSAVTKANVWLAAGIPHQTPKHDATWLGAKHESGLY